MIAANAFGMPSSGWLATPAMGADMKRTCAVRLIDRRTGAPHRINGTPLTVYTRDPQQAVAALLEGRDTTIWEARVEPLDPKVRR
jgi:hypothetical protein